MRLEEGDIFGLNTQIDVKLGPIVSQSIGNISIQF